MDSGPLIYMLGCVSDFRVRLLLERDLCFWFRLLNSLDLTIQQKVSLQRNLHCDVVRHFKINSLSLSVNKTGTFSRPK